MKLLKITAIASMTALMAISMPAVANSNTKSAPKAQTQKVDKNLQQFSNNIEIKLASRNVARDDKNQTILQFNYEVKNKSSKRDIKLVNWVAALTYNNQIVWMREVPLSFENGLKRNTSTKITMSVPATAFQPEVQKLMMDPNVQIGSIIGAKTLEFTNGTKIIVAK